jgi:FAD/FMN-containing dehydrogenase
MAMTPAAADLDERLEALRHRVDGDVLVPGDDGYGAFGRDEAVVVIAADVGDVIAAARFTAETGVAVSLDTSRMDEVELDAEERMAWVGAGARWTDVLDAAAAHGLAPVSGPSLAANAVNSTLAGEIGWLGRRHGSLGEAVRSFEVVTPDGELVRCCTSERSDLFRALLAGDGDGRGVVTEMEIELVPVRTVYAGELAYPVAAAREVVCRWEAWAPTTPDELTSGVVLTKTSVLLRGCWCGDPDEGRAVLDGWRASMPPTSDTWRASAHPDLVPIVDGDATTRWLPDPARGADLPPEVGAPSWPAVEIRHVGGSTAAPDRRFLLRAAS